MRRKKQEPFRANLNRLELPAYKKGLPQCTAGYETWIMHHASWITGATLIEIGV